MTTLQAATPGPKERAVANLRTGDVGIPDALDRTKGMTDKQINNLRDKLIAKNKKIVERRGLTSPAPKSSNLTEADKKAIADIQAQQLKEKAEKTAQRINELRASKGQPPVKPKATKAAKKTKSEKKPAAKPAEKKKSKPNKSDIVEAMLTSTKGATREELSKATGWPHVNLKVAAERAKKKLTEKNGRFFLT